MPIIPKLNRLFFLAIALVFPILLMGQSQTISPDGLGYYWFIKDSKVFKIDFEGNVKSSYSNLMLGNPSEIDPSDPFRIVVFYHGSQSIVIINNDANILGKPISLSDLGLGEVTLVSRSSRGGLWLLHRESAEIVRVDNQLSKVEQRIALPHEYGNKTLNCLVERGGVLFLGTDNESITMFDTYGAILETLKVTYEKTFRVEKNFLISSSNGLVQKRNLLDTDKNVEYFACHCGSNPLFVNGSLYCFDGEKFILCEKIDE